MIKIYRVNFTLDFESWKKNQPHLIKKPTGKGLRTVVYDATINEPKEEEIPILDKTEPNFDTHDPK